MNTTMDPSWVKALAPVSDTVTRLCEELSHERFLPAGPNVLRVFSRPVSAARVLLLGQDPYPTPGHAVGLSFSVGRDVRPIPASLRNIYAELHDDMGIAPAAHGDLSSWFEQGVMLMNRVLTVAPGRPASHRGRGWEEVTECAITTLCDAHRAGQPLVAVLWGRDARNQAEVLRAAGIPVVESAHPSPLSASSGFFGSRPFSRTNAHLVAQGAEPIDWRIA